VCEPWPRRMVMEPLARSRSVKVSAAISEERVVVEAKGEVTRSRADMGCDIQRRREFGRGHFGVSRIA
jgi:hypothetical protein